MRRRSLTGAAVVLALVFAACGSEDDKQSGGSEGGDDAVAALLDRTPGESTEIIAMDVAGAKRQLGIAPDLDPEDYRSRQSSSTPEGRFDNAALKIMGYVTGVGKTPITNALDHGAITAAVRAFSPGAGGELMIYRTTQPREVLERGLEKAGLRASGQDTYVVSKADAGTSLKAITLGEDGLAVVGESAAVTQGVERRTDPDPRLAPMRRLLDLPKGALRAVSSHIEQPREEAACVRRVAGGLLLTAGNEDEDLVLELSGVPRTSAVVLGTRVARKDLLYRSYRVSDVARDGQRLTLKVRTLAGSIANVNAATIAANGGSERDLLYSCPGAVAAKARAERRARREALPDPTPPDTSGSKLETAISQYIGAGSLAPPPGVRVRCPIKSIPRSLNVLRCKGTRRRSGRLYHYTIKVNLEYPRIESIDIDTPDDKTGEIVTDDDSSSKPKD